MGVIKNFSATKKDVVALSLTMKNAALIVKGSWVKVFFYF
jgi:hypothetical protein